jgi:signal transduction histidine kinase
MKRFWPAWLAFGFCVALAAVAIARVGAAALDLERAEMRARRQAAQEENVQLALWRMDSTIAPLIAEESARPYFAYAPLYPAERAFTNMFAEIQRGDVLVPSPLLTFSSPQIRLHFQYGPDGRLSSPQVPSGNMRDVAEARYLPPERIELAARRLEELGKCVSHKELAALLSVEEPGQSGAGTPLAFGPEVRSRGSNEFMMRSRATKLAQNAAPAEALPLTARSSVSQGQLQAIWVGRALLLARRVQVAEGTFLQGCWLDWDVIRSDLSASVSDLVSQLELEPVSSSSGLIPTRMLASLPARLSLAPPPDPRDGGWSPLGYSLLLAWASLALAATAIALLLHGALQLSERQATFISAVTHELRTPLTTFRLYTEMLDEGMVNDPGAQREYVKTLRTEADRLGHLVENVLAYARLERGRGAESPEVITPADLLDRLVPRLAQRARQVGVELASAPVTIDVKVRASVSVVDQILSNLVDNAIKYAGQAPDRRIHLAVAPAGRWLAFSVRDHGPGLTSQATRRLFQPFSKSARDAAHSAPGVGLGLALSRRLARSLGGDLRLHENGPLGASFVLLIPVASHTLPGLSH